jgi:peptide-methionine (S)-S-oxide reductase
MALSYSAGMDVGPTRSLPSTPMARLTVGGGCFWCLEAVFLELRGVSRVISGYAGGRVEHPTYEQVCTGRTGHAEVVRVEFDPRILPLRDLLTVFFTVHDPTTLNRQGGDVGTQYRSVVLYDSPEQKAAAEKVVDEIAASRIWRGKIVTEIAPLATFYPAEEYHRDYFARHPEQAYCRMVIEPKVAKFRAHFVDRLRASPSPAEPGRPS